MRRNILLSEIKQIKNRVKTEFQMEGCIEAEQAVTVGVTINGVSRGHC